MSLWTGLLLAVPVARANAQVVSNRANGSVPVEVLEMEGIVEISSNDGLRWFACRTNEVLSPGDRVRTRQNSRTTLRLTDLSLMRIDQLSEFQVQPAPGAKTAFVYKLWRGAIYFFHRDKPANVRFDSPTASAAVRGTEFNLQVTENGSTILTMLEGEVELSAAGQATFLRSHEQGTVDPGQPPRKTAVLETVNIIQWCLYYPAVLDADELSLSDDESQALAESLNAYRQGEILQALAKYPAGREPGSAMETVYYAALLLAVGQVEKAEALLRPLVPAGEEPQRATLLAASLRRLIFAVKRQTDPSALKPQLSTSLVAESYYHQSRANLEMARDTARRAVESSPQFGFAWARLAELEFSFGRTKQARVALRRSQELSPRNAQALALSGFVLSAENRIAEAITYFNMAIEIDGALGNAWLGRGLCEIKQGHTKQGLDDVQMAAILEPQRALFRSYLGKAFSNAGDNQLARRELRLAKELDPYDPSAWLYSALVNEEDSRINESVRELEKSQALNTNRMVYRSRLLLDQDDAVRGANLANAYQNAGMAEVSLREAARAVNTDYGNFSAHLFLANSLNALRDPQQINLRYETPWLSEYLIANLLAPVNAGPLSPAISQQEYSRLFERDGLHVNSSTEYLSSGDWLQSGVAYGTYGNTSFAAEANYRSENGYRPNNDLEQLTVSARFKQQLTPQDSIYLQSVYYDTDSGDVTPYYDDRDARLGLRVRESQMPLLLAGYHRQWAPNSHTLFLVGYLEDTLEVSDTNQTVFLRYTNASGVFALPYPALPGAGMNYRTDFKGFSGEMQHIWRLGGHGLIGGVRYQTGTFDTSDMIRTYAFSGIANLTFTNTAFAFAAPGTTNHFSTEFKRFSVYAYDNWEIADSVLVSAGVSYDYLDYPLDFRSPPIASSQRNKSLVSPKVGVIYTPFDRTAIRGAYTRSLGGVAFDQSVRLEPTQVAGFNQAFRSLIPEAVAGALAGAGFETFGLALDQSFTTGTYLGLQAEVLRSDVKNYIGAVNIDATFPPEPNNTVSLQRLDFEERNLFVTFNQLLGDQWALGAQYRLSHANLNLELPDLIGVSPFAVQDLTGILHRVNLYALFNHPSGIFSQVEAIWSQQSNQGYTPDIPGDDFWQFNAFVGYRFPRRKAEIRVGLFNITDQNYQLNPLNLSAELPHDRTLAVSLKFRF